jgi:Cytochrome C oxidase, cbb3-type, subunit III
MISERSVMRLASYPRWSPKGEPRKRPIGLREDRSLRRVVLAIHQGERLFQRYSAPCHGDVEVSGGVLPDLRYSSALACNEWFSDVLDGMLQSEGMISFAPELSHEDAARIRSYVVLGRKQTLAERGKTR